MVKKEKKLEVQAFCIAGSFQLLAAYQRIKKMHITASKSKMLTFFLKKVAYKINNKKEALLLIRN